VELERVVIDVELRPKAKPTGRVANASARSVLNLESPPEQKSKAANDQ
jgi:hypothetical protein